MNAAPQIAALFADGAVAYQTLEVFSSSDLMPEEQQYVSGAVEKRVSEFAAGRECARAGLAKLGYGRIALPAGADRAPLWPPGATGSITHTHGLCAAVVAPSARIRALGLDVERSNCVRPELWRRICTSEELEELKRMSDSEALLAATLIFSAKEAFYKCQHNLTAQWLGFADIRITLGTDRFSVTPTRSLEISTLIAGPWEGHYRHEPEHVVTGICIV